MLVAAYAAVAAAVPDAGSARLARLRSLAAEHEAHVVALEGPPPTASPSPSTSTGSPSPSAAPPQVPSTPAAAVTWLAGLERAAADRRTGQVLRAGADLGRLLASIARLRVDPRRPARPGEPVSQLAPAARRQSEVLQRVLAGEHAVVYGYGVAGARLSGADRVRAERGWTAHRARRDRLEAQLSRPGRGAGRRRPRRTRCPPGGHRRAGPAR